MTVLGAVAMVVGSFLVWAQYSVAGSVLPNGIRMPMRSMYQPAVLATDSPLTSPGTLVIILAVIGVLGLLERSGLITILAGLLAGGAVVAAVSIQIVQGRPGDSPYDVLGIGVYVTALGCVLMLVGGVVQMSWMFRFTAAYGPLRRR